MKLNSPEKLLVIALALLLGQNAGAGQLLPAAAGDRIPPAPQSSKVLLDSTLERAPVALSWKIDASAPIESNSPAFRAESREFWIEVSARQLQDGLNFTTTASGAVIRISPVLAMRSAPVDPRQLRLSRDGVDLDATTAIASVLRTEDRSEGSESFPEGSSAFRLAASAGRAGPGQRSEGAGAVGRARRADLAQRRAGRG